MLCIIRLLGNLGAAPEQSKKRTNDGEIIVSFSLAVNRTWHDQGGQKQQETTWYRVTATGSLAEVALSLKRGEQVLVVSDQIRVNAYQAKDGPRAQIDVRAKDIISLSGAAGRASQGWAAPEEVWEF